MGFLGVMVQAQSVDVKISVLKLREGFAGKIRREAFLPELVFSLNFPFGLWGWSITKTNVVELERPAQLGERVRVMGEKDGVIIDVKLEWPSVGQKGGGQEIKIGQEEFPLIDF